MSLQIDEREIEGITILDLRGSLTFGEGDLALRDKLRALHQAGKINFVLNLKEVSHLDSTGLGTLVFMLARLRKAGGNLALANLNRAHLELLQLTSLTMVFEVYQDAQDAVNSFFPDRTVNCFDILNFVQEEEAEKAGGGAPAAPEAKSPGGSGSN
jgi:anti-sigma B factor antagonist